MFCSSNFYFTEFSTAHFHGFLNSFVKNGYLSFLLTVLPSHFS